MIYTWFINLPLITPFDKQRKEQNLMNNIRLKIWRNDISCINLIKINLTINKRREIAARNISIFPRKLERWFLFIDDLIGEKLYPVETELPVHSRLIIWHVQKLRIFLGNGPGSSRKLIKFQNYWPGNCLRAV